MLSSIKIKDRVLYIDHEEGKKFIDLLNEILILIEMLDVKANFYTKIHNLCLELDYQDRYVSIVLTESQEEDLNVIREIFLYVVYKDELNNDAHEMTSFLSSGIDEFLVPLEKFKEMMINEV